MKLALVLAAALFAASLGQRMIAARAIAPNPAGTEICPSSGAQQYALNMICFYKCTAGVVAITVNNHQLCSLNITR